MRLAVTNSAVIAVGCGIFTWIVAAYAQDETGVSSPTDGESWRPRT